MDGDVSASGFGADQLQLMVVAVDQYHLGPDMNGVTGVSVVEHRADHGASGLHDGSVDPLAGGDRAGSRRADTAAWPEADHIVRTPDGCNSIVDPGRDWDERPPQGVAQRLGVRLTAQVAGQYRSHGEHALDDGAP